jgi:DNA processing protein
MKINKLTLSSPDFPEVLRQMHKPPTQIYHTGADLNELLKLPRVSMIGTRQMSPYGEQAARRLARELAEQGIVIISGLAMGIDAAAHRAALEAGGLCIAVLPSPLEEIVPVSNRALANQILQQGGALISEYPAGDYPKKQYFIARNRLMSALGQAVVIIEAGEKSGALHTARFAIQQGRDVLAVPGSIYSQGSVGTNNLIKTLSAAPVTELADILHALGLESHQTPAAQVRGRNKNEQSLLDLLLRGITDGDQLLQHSGLATAQFNQALTMLEIGGKIRPLGGNQWAIY